MSAHLTHEWRDVPVAYQHIDGLGYLRCHDCTPPELRAELEFAVSPQSEMPCDCCRRLVGSVTVLTRARATVEHTPCRIF